MCTENVCLISVYMHCSLGKCSISWHEVLCTRYIYMVYVFKIQITISYPNTYVRMPVHTNTIPIQTFPFVHTIYQPHRTLRVRVSHNNMLHQVHFYIHFIILRWEDFNTDWINISVRECVTVNESTNLQLNGRFQFIALLLWERAWNWCDSPTISVCDCESSINSMMRC